MTVAHTLARYPLIKRITGYSAGSLIAAPLGEAAFLAAYGWGHAGTTWASAAGFVAGTVPNYIFNRRWAWSDRRGRKRRSELILYVTVAISTFLASAIGTHWAQAGARQLTTDHGWRVVLVAGAFLAVSGVFFVGKFVCFELIVFRPAAGDAAPPTTS
jgi:putative flippase GtrA